MGHEHPKDESTVSILAKARDLVPIGALSSLNPLTP